MGQDLTDILSAVREANGNIDAYGNQTRERIASHDKAIDDLYRKVNRPGGFGGVRDDDLLERKDAEAYCRTRRALTIPKIEANASLDYSATPGEIDEAMTAKKAMRALLRHGDPSRLEPTEKKSLSSFAFGSNSFILAPQISNQILSCLVDETDITGLVNNVQISGPSIKFLIDNVRMQTAAWACQAACFANNPVPDLQEGRASAALPGGEVGRIPSSLLLT